MIEASAHLRLREIDGRAQVGCLALGQAIETVGEVVDRFVFLVLVEQIAELADDALLREIGLLGIVQAAVAGAACLLEQNDDCLHLLIAQFAQHRADGSQRFHIGAITHAVAVEFADDVIDLLADGLGLGAKLLLVGFLGTELIGG